MQKIWEQLTVDNWCQRAMAKNADYYVVNSNSSAACMWCANGWIKRTYGLKQFGRKKKLLKAVIGEDSISRWNDYAFRTWQEVRDAFKAADL